MMECFSRIGFSGWPQDGLTIVVTSTIGTFFYSVPYTTWSYVSEDVSMGAFEVVGFECKPLDKWAAAKIICAKGERIPWLVLRICARFRLRRIAGWLFNGRWRRHEMPTRYELM